MAGIIKAGSPHTPSLGASGASFHFGDMENAYLDRVRAEAQTIVAKARQEAAAIQAQAAEQGRQAAMQAAEQTLRIKVDQHLQGLTPALTAAVDELRNSRDTWQRHWEQNGLQLSLAIAERIVRREVSKTPEIVVTLVREALELAAGSPKLTVRMNPANHAALGEQVVALTKQISRLGEATIVADPSISLGGCRVDTEFGSIDQTIETQLARITEELS